MPTRRSQPTRRDGGIPLALTFDDVLLLPAHSKVHPRDVDLRTRLTDGISLNVPPVSAPWTPSRSRGWPSPWRSRAASGSSTRT
jgi:hypothetical protein